MDWLRHPLRTLRRAAHDSSELRGTGHDEIRNDAQSLGFAIDICALLQREWSPLHEALHLSLLDVGARTATGSNLIARTFHPSSWSLLKLRVTAIDIDPFYEARARSDFPGLDYRVQDVMETRGRWDIVTCSHTLEHIEDPRPVMRQLLRLATRMVVVAAPWKEPEEGRYELHRFSFDEVFFEEFPPTIFESYRSPHWHGGDCFIAAWRLDGAGEG